MIMVMMGEKNTPKSITLRPTGVDMCLKHRPLVIIGRSRLDQEKLGSANQIGIGMSRRWQSRCSKGKERNIRSDLATQDRLSPRACLSKEALRMMGRTLSQCF